MVDKYNIGRAVVQMLKANPMLSVPIAVATTKYSPLPVNTRMLLRSTFYPEWGMTEKDLTDKELNALRTAALMSEERTKYLNIPSEIKYMEDILKLDDNKRYPQYNNDTGKNIKEGMRRHRTPNTIQYEDYWNAVDAPDDIEERSKYMDFTRHNYKQMIENSFSNPLYALQTTVGRADLNGNKIVDTYNFLDRDQNRSKDYDNIHRWASRLSNPMDVNIDLYK